MKQLQPSQRRYLLDAACGLTAQQSAIRHGVSVNTVNSSLKRAKGVLDARNITHAVVLCLSAAEFSFEDVRNGS